MCRESRCTIPLIISIIAGIIIAVLFFTGTIAAAVITTPIIFATAFAGISLVLLFIAAVFATRKEVKQCICEHGKCLLLGGFGTIIAGFLALTFIAALVAGSVIAALLLGIGGALFVLNLITLIALFICLVNSNCSRKESCFKYDDDYKH